MGDGERYLSQENTEKWEQWVKQEERKGLKNGVLLILGQGKVHKKPPF